MHLICCLSNNNSFDSSSGPQLHSGISDKFGILIAASNGKQLGSPSHPTWALFIYQSGLFTVALTDIPCLTLSFKRDFLYLS